MFTRGLFFSASKFRLITNNTGTFKHCISTANRSKRTRRGTKAGRNVLRSIQTVISSLRDQIQSEVRGINHDNLIPLVAKSPRTMPTIVRQRSDKMFVTREANMANLLKPLKSLQRHVANQLSLTLLNARSVKNKAFSISDYLISNETDILALTETWLGSTVDKCVLSELVPDG